MQISFDFIDWIIGLSLLGGSSIALLIGLILLRPSLSAVLVPVGIFVIGIAVTLLIDLALQYPPVEDFFLAGTHKRHAMRTFLPWSLGLVAGLLTMGGWFRYVTRTYK